jgi:hypothetical protein
MAVLPGGVSAQNILNNGGFETGLMCYNFWTNSVTGVDFAGDFQFTLSTDSHSGNYSFQIACKPGGTDCARAYLYTQSIPAIPSQNYTVSVWVKCPAGGGGWFSVSDGATVGGLAANMLACNTDWTFNTMNFQTSSTATTYIVYLLNYNPQPLLIDDLVVTYADGTAPLELIFIRETAPYQFRDRM